MEAILYIGHGSRAKMAQEQSVEFFQSCIAKNWAPIQEYCFLELAKPSIEDAIKICIAKGATKITAVPYFLLSAGHTKVDIPNELTRIWKKYPQICLNYCSPIGVHPLISDILLERIKESKTELSADSRVLIVGRGSSDQEARKDLLKIAKLFKLRAGLKRVDTCFLTGVLPSFEATIQSIKPNNDSTVVIIPYLLFAGVLLQKIAAKISESQSGGQMVLLNHLGNHPGLVEIVRERIITAKPLHNKSRFSSQAMLQIN